MKKPHPPTTKNPVTDAVKQVDKLGVGRHSRKTIAERIVEAAGDEFHIINSMMCDRSVSHAFVWRVVKAMGINCSYVHIIQTVRPWFEENYGYYHEIVNNDKETSRPVFLETM